MKKIKLAVADSMAHNILSKMQKGMGDRIEDLPSSIETKQSVIMDLQTEFNSLTRDIAACHNCYNQMKWLYSVISTKWWLFQPGITMPIPRVFQPSWLFIIL